MHSDFLNALYFSVDVTFFKLVFLLVIIFGSFLLLSLFVRFCNIVSDHFTLVCLLNLLLSSLKINSIQSFISLFYTRPKFFLLRLVGQEMLAVIHAESFVLQAASQKFKD